MAICLKRNTLLSRLKPLFTLQRLEHSLVEGKTQTRHLTDKDYDEMFGPGNVNTSKWKKVDSRSLGIRERMIPNSSLTVLRTLQKHGFKAYLVGGCVRDLILKRTPKDFDVITTAPLKEIRKYFHRLYRCHIVGRRFPICIVNVRGSVVEVSSFETVAQHAGGKENFLFSKMPRGRDKLDLLRWRNSMHRDFTVNSLFFDPLLHKIYDYTTGMNDIFKLKLRTLVPAHLSFTEDCARILRGMRLSARLGMSLSEEIEIAISKHASSVANLAKSRLMMELNYMLSYGAAERSLCLLQRFHLLEIFLPFHAAYLSHQAARDGQSSFMLMKLFFNLDQLVTCDQPCDERLWVGLLAFHIAILNNPQHPLVVLAFASILYHARWKEGLIYARQHAPEAVKFVPEILEPFDFDSDEELAEKVNQLAVLVQHSVDALTQTDSLLNMMERFPGFPCSGLVFVSRNMGCDVAELFEVLASDRIKTYTDGRHSFQINRVLLGKGHILETRFALGKIIMDTMGCGIDQGSKINKENSFSNTMENGMNIKRPLSPSNSMPEQEHSKKQKLTSNNIYLLGLEARKLQIECLESKLEVIADRFLTELEESQEVTKKNNKVTSNAWDGKAQVRIKEKEKDAVDRSAMQELIGMLETVMDNSIYTIEQQEVLEKKQDEVEKDTEAVEKQLKGVEKNTHQDVKTENEKVPIDSPKIDTKNTGKHKRPMVEEKSRKSPLSSLFRRI